MVYFRVGKFSLGSLHFFIIGIIQLDTYPWCLRKVLLIWSLLRRSMTKSC